MVSSNPCRPKNRNHIQADYVTPKTAAGGIYFLDAAGGNVICFFNATTHHLQIDIVDELTAAAGVTLDGVKLKDSEVYTDVIHEKTAATGVTLDGVLLKDGAVTGSLIPANLDFSTIAAVTAAGTTQGTATAITEGINNVTAMSTPLSVRLPLISVWGRKPITLNSVGMYYPRVFPGVGDTIMGCAQNAYATMASPSVFLFPIDATTWSFLGGRDSWL